MKSRPSSARARIIHRPTARRHGLTLALCLAVAMLLIDASLQASDLRLRFVDPVVTGPGINPLLELPNATQRDLRHFSAVNSMRSNGFLYVHLPGSGGLPENSQAVIRHAAESGFHALSLAYPNWPSVGALTNTSGDPSAPGAVRHERLFGIDSSPLVQVDEANSVINRLRRLLEFLDAENPDEGWGRFIHEQQPAWRLTLVGGHSQGSGHAAYLAQEFRLAGALIFGGPGDFVLGSGPANWVYRPLRTELATLNALVHRNDPNYNGFLAIQGLLGLDASGPVQDVDLVPRPDWTAQRLTSTRQDIPGGNFHGAVVVDSGLPLNPDGQIGYLDAWSYMLGSVLFASGFE